MDQQLEQLRTEALAAIAGAADETVVEQVRIKYLGQSGALTAVSKGMKDVSKDDKPRIGKLLNDVRTAVTAALDERKAALLAGADAAAFAGVDVTLPGTSGSPLPFLMYPQAQSGARRYDPYDPDNFKYTITAREIKVS